MKTDQMETCILCGNEVGGEVPIPPEAHGKCVCLGCGERKLPAENPDFLAPADDVDDEVGFYCETNF